MYLHKNAIFYCLILSNVLSWNSAAAKQKFCGKTITDALNLICINGYNTFPLSPLQKRANVDKDKMIAFNDDDVAEYILYLTGHSFVNRINPLFVKMYKNKLTMIRQQRSENIGKFRGIYDECCIQACSYGELAAYCRPTY